MLLVTCLKIMFFSLYAHGYSANSNCFYIFLILQNTGPRHKLLKIMLTRAFYNAVAEQSIREHNYPQIDVKQGLKITQFLLAAVPVFSRCLEPVLALWISLVSHILVTLSVFHSLYWGFVHPFFLHNKEMILVLIWPDHFTLLCFCGELWATFTMDRTAFV